ncbi:MAG: hypothetical protein L6R37_006315 [Teloschistes peruensis]|nr:MAG: hypothetical protein L6R37_006315 [Teloschistes peruensis]
MGKKRSCQDEVEIDETPCSTSTSSAIQASRRMKENQGEGFPCTRYTPCQRIIKSHRKAIACAFYKHYLSAPISTYHTLTRNQLEACKQKNRPFHEFVTEFRSYAHWTGFPDEVVRHRLIQNCSAELRATFIYNRPPNGLTEAYNYLQEVWNRMTVYQPSAATQSRKMTSTTPSSFATRNTGPSTGSLTTFTTQASTPAGTTTLTTSQGGNAMDLSAIRTNLDESGKLKESVKQYRRTNILCLYCGNHPSTQTCPFHSRLAQRDQQRGRQPNRVNTAATTVEEVAENA